MSDLVINRTPELIAAEINNIKNQTRKMVLYNSIEIGRRLTEAKQLVSHGEWGGWLEASVDYSQRTASNLMRIFEEYGADQLTLLGDNSKSQALANLSYTQAVALLGVPEEEREEFVGKHDIDNMSTRELQQAIKERDEAVKKLKDAIQTAKAKEDEASKLQQDLKKEQEHSVVEITRLRKSIEELKDKIKDAEDSGNDEEIDALNDSLKKTEDDLNWANSRILELEKQLKEKPIEATVATIEKVPEEIEKELEDLRRKALVGGAAEKFAIYFDELVKDFQKLLGVLAEIAGTDEESYSKYKNAINALLSKMGEKVL
ncbi:MAG: hypothetical protein K0S75_845 [Clostridia bacterium]|jgi:chromosome segregation ATPase|nr:hypothetical protein [Clostridia bacterium]